MNKYQLVEVLDIVQWAGAYAKTDGQYIRVRKAREWIENEIKQITQQELAAEKPEISETSIQ